MANTKQIHFINFSRKLTVNSLFFLVPLHFLKLGFSGWQIGIIMSFFAFAPLLFSFPTGWINDRFSMERIIKGALFALSILFLLLALTKNFVLLIFIFLLIGIANNGLDISINSLYFKDEVRLDLNRKYGLYNFWLALGMAAGTFFGGILTFYANFQTLFYVYGIFQLVIFFLAKDLGEERFEAIPFKIYKRNIFQKKTILFSILIYALALHWGVEGTVYSPFLRSYFSLNNFELAMFISLPLLALAFSSLSIGLLRYNVRQNRRIFLLAMFFSGLGLVLMVNRKVYLAFLFRVLHEIGDGFLGALIFLYISQLFEKKSIGGSSGILMAIQTIGHMVGAFFFSSLGFKAGLNYPFLVAGLILCANSFYGHFVFSKEFRNHNE